MMPQFLILRASQEVTAALERPWLATLLAVDQPGEQVLLILFLLQLLLQLLLFLCPSWVTDNAGLRSALLVMLPNVLAKSASTEHTQFDEGHNIRRMCAKDICCYGISIDPLL